jgi:hypothetical protein
LLSVQVYPEGIFRKLFFGSQIGDADTVLITTQELEFLAGPGLDGLLLAVSPLIALVDILIGPLW